MSRKYTLWYFISGLALVAVLVLAVILNENYSSDTSIVEGIGAQVESLPGLPDCWLVLCKPDFSLSTAL